MREGPHAEPVRGLFWSKSTAWNNEKVGEGLPTWSYFEGRTGRSQKQRVKLVGDETPVITAKFGEGRA